MTKQEFLAMSLPYGLEVKVGEARTALVGISTDDYYVSYWGGVRQVENVTPILHPLSDLTKEIEHKGEKFLPINRIKESQYHLFFRDDITSPLEGLQFSELRKLIEWHFDIADLISKGEAIDVNTLEINPYK